MQFSANGLLRIADVGMGVEITGDGIAGASRSLLYNIHNFFLP